MRARGSGTRGLRADARPVLIAALIGMLAIGLALGLAGCGDDGDETTTTAVTTAPEMTTSTGPAAEETTTTEAVESSTTTLPEETTTTTAAETTTTTEALSSAETRLPNGNIKAMGFIDKVWEEGGKRYISIDYAEMLTGQEAIDAAIEAGEIQPGEDLPNDYYIRNTNPEKRVFEVASPVSLTTSTWHGEMNKPIPWEVFKSFWSATPVDDEAGYLRDVPWWIERDGPIVIKIDEQYLP